MADEKITIMIADDHNSARESYIRSLQDQENFSIIGSAENGIDLISLIEKNIPHIIIIDLEMPKMNGSEVLKVVRKKFPSIKPIVLSAFYTDYYAANIVDQGACAYLPKSCYMRELITAINKVYKEGFYFNGKASQALVSSVRETKKLSSISKQLSLTERETDVLKLIFKSKTNQQIAELLRISVRTVEFHRGSIYKKTNSESIVELTIYAIKNGIISVE